MWYFYLFCALCTSPQVPLTERSRVSDKGVFSSEIIMIPTDALLTYEANKGLVRIHTLTTIDFLRPKIPNEI